MNEEIISLFGNFLKKVFIEKKSFLKDSHNEPIYTKKNLEKIIEIYIKNPIYLDKKNIESESSKKFLEFKQMYNKEPNYFDKIKIQFTSADDDYKLIFSDILWLRYLPIHNITIEKKKKACTSLGVLEESEIENKFPKNERGLASYGQLIQHIYKDTIFLVNFLYYLLETLEKKKNGKENNVNVNSIKEEIINKILGEKDYSLESETEDITSNESIKNKVPIASMLLYLCNQNDHEPIASFPHKLKIIKYFGRKYYNDNDCIIKFNGNDVDTKKTEDLNFKQIEGAISSIKSKIKNDKNLITDEEKKRFEAKGFYYHKVRSLWDDNTLASVESILENYKKEIILYGAPGTGKTYNAELVRNKLIVDLNNNISQDPEDLDKEFRTKYKFGEIFKVYKKTLSVSSGLNIYGVDLNNNIEISKNDIKFIWEIIQLNQSYTYEDFIEGLYPDEQGKLYIRNGIFKEFCLAAEKYSGIKFLLIVDEINRGKIDKIFGELLFALEYRNNPIKLHYSREDLLVPENLYIIGTMNTADKNIAMIDIALRRRFWFVKLLADRNILIDHFGLNFKDLKEPSKKINEPKDVKVLAIKLFDFLNGFEKNEGRIKSLLKSDSEGREIGHSYFQNLIPKSNNLSEKDTEIKEEDCFTLFEKLRNIWFYSIIPLLEEYCNYNLDTLLDMLKIGNNKNLFNPQDFFDLFENPLNIPNK